MSRLEMLYRRSGLFSWYLGRSNSLTLPLPVLSDPWRGNATIGAQIMQDNWPYSLDSLKFSCFDWVRDLRDFGGTNARLLARNLINRWMAENRFWSARNWQPDIMGARLANLILTYGWFGDSADEAFQQKFAQMIQIQATCLSMDWQRLHAPLDQLMALKGLIFSQVLIHQSPDKRLREREINALFDLLIPKIRGQLFPDGGHKTREPETHLHVLKILLECRTAISHLGIKEVPIMEDIILKMSAVIKMLRHPSGRLAHFQSGGLSSAEYIDQILARCGAKGRIMQHAPDTGYARLSAARNTVIIDTGQTSEAVLSTKMRPDLSELPSASLFAFEFSVGSNLLVVNSGQTAKEARLRKALSQTSAHSTLTLDGLDNQQKQTRTLTFDIGAADGGMLVEASHDGYLPSHGIIHKRQFFLSQNGNQLKGSDQLTYSGAPGQIPVEVIIRFHLHPMVSAARTKAEQILLKIHAQKRGWIFKCRGAESFLDQSVYFEGHRRISCQQIVLRCPASQIQTKGTLTVNWAFARLSA